MFSKKYMIFQAIFCICIQKRKRKAPSEADLRDLANFLLSYDVKKFTIHGITRLSRNFTHYFYM